ncbi:MAG: hypothetical protein RJB62_731, partial [Pseudomonadota bacterium]
MSGTVEILKLGHAGDGVTANGLFLPYTVPGDVVRLTEDAKPRVAEIVTAGAWRKIPDCAHFGKCGGCALQHVDTQAYLAWKRDLIVTALAQRG